MSEDALMAIMIFWSMFFPAIVLAITLLGGRK